MILGVSAMIKSFKKAHQWTESKNAKSPVLDAGLILAAVVGVSYAAQEAFLFARQRARNVRTQQEQADNEAQIRLEEGQAVSDLGVLAGEPTVDRDRSATMGSEFTETVLSRRGPRQSLV